jgi:hypothetical protein
MSRRRSTQVEAPQARCRAKEIAGAPGAALRALAADPGG